MVCVCVGGEGGSTGEESEDDTGSMQRQLARIAAGRRYQKRTLVINRTFQLMLAESGQRQSSQSTGFVFCYGLIAMDH